MSVCDCRWLRTIRPRFCVLCLAEGCPGLCNGNGRCTLDLNGWHCVCQLGWRGAGCDTSMETACGDSKDNDGGKAPAPRGPMQLQWGVGVGPQGGGWALSRPQTPGIPAVQSRRPAGQAENCTCGLRNKYVSPLVPS